jgi:hypothetical protein
MQPAAEQMPRSLKLQTASFVSGGRMKSAVAELLEK